MILRPEEYEKELHGWNTAIKSFIESESSFNEVYTKTNITEIVEILNRIGSEESKSSNVVYLPKIGDDNLTSAVYSEYESGCIELKLGASIYVVKPKSLTFFIVNSGNLEHPNYEWSVLKLETLDLQPSGIYDNITGKYEALLRLPNGELIDQKYADIGYFGYTSDGDEKTLPPSTVYVHRELEGGAFYITFMSPQNRRNDVLDRKIHEISDSKLLELLEKLAHSSEK